MPNDQTRPIASKHEAYMAEIRSRIAKALDAENSFNAATREDRAQELGMKWAIAKKLPLG